jgi:hypothetical protein
MSNLRYASTPPSDTVLQGFAGNEPELFGQNTASRNVHDAKYDRNHEAIERAYRILINKLGKIPSNAQIAKETGLAERTIYNHLDEIDIPKLLGSRVKVAAPYIDQILYDIIRASHNGNTRASELFLQVVFGWRPGQKVETEQPKQEYSEEEIERLKASAIYRASRRTEVLEAKTSSSFS